MRSVWLKAVFVILSAGAAYGQTNPHTQIRWPANCSSNNYMVYNWLANTCVLIGPVGNTGEVQYNNAGAWASSAGFTYNSGTNTLSAPNLNIPGTSNITIPPTQITWPTGCNAANQAYSLAANACITVGPVGISGSMQINQNGAWATAPGFTYDFVNNVLTVPNITVAGLANFSVASGVITWPPSCTTGVYVPATNTCVPSGTAANPGGTTGQLQYNNAGSFSGAATQIVQCAGVNDTTPLQNALNIGGRILVNGDCVLTPAGAGLIIKSNTDLNLDKATISWNPTAVGQMIIQNTQSASQTIQRTLTDVVATAGSLQITSATGAFTQSDVGQSINCLGAYGTGSAVGWAPNVGPDLHTTIVNITSATSVTLADPAYVAANPTTCQIIYRDRNISITGGQLSYQGQNTQNSGQIIKMKTINNVTIDGVTTWDGPIPTSGSGNSTGTGGFQIYVLDASNVKVSNTTVHGWISGQDGIHMVGPLRDVSISHAHGHSGDDFIALNQAEGTGASNTQVDGNIYGNIQGVLIDDVSGNSYQSNQGVKLAGVFNGNPLYTRDVTVRHVHGLPNTCTTVGCAPGDNRSGFGYGVLFYTGNFDNILVEDVGGVNLGPSVGFFGGTIGSVTLRNLSQSKYVFSNTGLATGLVTIQPGQGSVAMNNPNISIADLTIDGIKSFQYNLAQDVLVNRTSTIGRLRINNVQLGNMTGGNFTPFTLSGTYDDIILSNIQMNLVSGNTTVSTASLIQFLGTTANHITIDHFHVTYQTGALSNGTGVIQEGTLQPGNFTSAIGDILLNDITVNAPIGANFSQAVVYISGPTVNTLTSFTMLNSHVQGIAGCVWNPPYPVATVIVANVTTASLGAYASSCNSSLQPTNVNGALGVYGAQSSYGSVNTVALASFPVASIATAATGGNGTLLDNTPYFYKLAWINAQGIGTVGAERTVTTCPSSTCSNLSTITLSSFGTVATGATGINLYRGTATGAELLCTGSPFATSNASIIDTGFTCSGAAVPAAGVNTSGGNISTAQHINQSATKNIAGTCAMASATSCTITINNAFTSAPICVATAQGSTTTAFAACSVGAGSTTVTVTASASNSLTWGVVLIGNPN